MEYESFYPAAFEVVVMKGTAKKSVGAACYPQVSPWFESLLFHFLYFCLFILVETFHGETFPF